jgi:hypothetical protein
VSDPHGIAEWLADMTQNDKSTLPKGLAIVIPFLFPVNGLQLH